MATIEIAKLHKVTSRGRTYYYAWRGGPRIEAQPGTKEFFDEIAHYRNPMASLDRRKIATWVAKFKASPEYNDLGHESKYDMAPKLDSIAQTFGMLSVGALDKPQIRGHIKEWRDQWRATPRTADKAKGYFSRLCSFMIEEGVLATNPCAGIANIYVKTDRSEIIWTPEDMGVMHGTEGVSQEIKDAMEFASLVGLRQSALLACPWTRVEKLCINMKGTKFGGKGRGVIPIYPALRTFLDRLEKRGRRALTVLTNTDGEPWGSGFGASWNTAMKRSKLKARGLHFHDLRGTAATNFYLAGLSIQEIADMMGWQTKDVETLINTYVKKDELLLARIAKMAQISVLPASKREQA
jgi:integrase